MGNWNRDLANTDESTTKKQKVTFKSSLSEIIEEIANCGNIDTVVYVESSCDVPEMKMTSRSFPELWKRNKLSELFMTLKAQGIKYWKPIET